MQPITCTGVYIISTVKTLYIAADKMTNASVDRRLLIESDMSVGSDEV